MRRALGTFAVLALLSPGAAHAHSGVVLGEPFATAAGFCPSGSLPADGRILMIRQNQALYSLLGDRYGGDGRKDFALPKLNPDGKGHDGPRFAPRGVMLTWCIVTNGDYPPHP